MKVGMISRLEGPVAQLGERLPCTQEVIGSIPFRSILLKSAMTIRSSTHRFASIAVLFLLQLVMFGCASNKATYVEPSASNSQLATIATYGDLNFGGVQLSSIDGLRLGDSRKSDTYAALPGQREIGVRWVVSKTPVTKVERKTLTWELTPGGSYLFEIYRDGPYYRPTSALSLVDEAGKQRHFLTGSKQGTSEGWSAPPARARPENLGSPRGPGR